MAIPGWSSGTIEVGVKLVKGRKFLAASIPTADIVGATPVLT
jgi:hypothetical protein